MKNKIVANNKTVIVYGGQEKRAFELFCNKEYFRLLSDKDKLLLFQTLLLEHQPVKDSRTNILDLNDSLMIDYYGLLAKITNLLIKGIRFQSNDVLLPHQGQGFVLGTLKAYSDGRIYLKKADTTPDGGCVIHEAKNEFEMTLLAYRNPLLRSRKVFTKIPLAYGIYPNLFYSYPDFSCNKGQRENMGFVVYANNRFLNLRTGKANVDISPYDYLNTVRRIGKTLRDLHDANIFHGSLHPSNIHILPSFVIVHDFPDAVDLSKLPIKQRIGFMFADLYYAAKKAEEIVRGGERAVLDGYLGEDTSNSQENDNLDYLYEILKLRGIDEYADKNTSVLLNRLINIANNAQ